MNEQQNLSADRQTIMDSFIEQVNCLHQGKPSGFPPVKRVIV